MKDIAHLSFDHLSFKSRGKNMKLLPYRPDMDIRNVQEVTSARGCKYLLCIQGPGDILIAKSWHRKLKSAKRHASSMDTIVFFYC